MRPLARDPEMLEMLGLGGGPAEPSASGEVLPPGAGGAFTMAGGAYEGADRFDRELAMWSPAIRSADMDILPEKSTMDSRTRDVVRNDAYVASGANIHKDNIVGSHYLLNAKPEFKVLGLDEKWAEEFQEEIETRFALWAESPQNWPDAARINTLTGLVRLAVGVYVMSGEVLASVEWLRASGRPYHTAVQMIDLDRLSTPPHHAADPRVRGGVRRDRYGAPLGYYIQVAHPTDYMVPNAYEWRYVEARKPAPWNRIQMIHILEQFRPDQTRGVAEMVSALKELRITKKFRDIVLQNAVVNATYAASIESDLPSETVYQALGAGNLSADAVAGAVAQYAGGYMSAINTYASNSKNMHLDGVKIPHFFPGTRLKLQPAGQGGPLGQEFEQSLLRYIAANLGVSYEQLSRDYTKTNYSSARAAMSETWKYMQSRKTVVADRFATNIYRVWLEEDLNAGNIQSLPARMKRDKSWFYDGLGAEALSACDWIGASRGQIDELKETQAAVLRLKHNLSTDEDELARLGKDWRKVKRQRAREKEVDDKLGLTPEEDEMMNAASGAPRESEDA